MYELSFVGTTSAGWSQAVELIDDNTNLPLALDDNDIVEMTVRDRDGCQVLHATTEDGTITRPQPGIVQWQFDPDRMDRLCGQTTYKVGCTVTNANGTTQLFIGTLSYLYGVV